MSRNSVPIDPAAGRAVSKGISEKLKQTLGSDTQMPDRLQELLNQLRQNEESGLREHRNGG
ncbi:MAG: hypothetical protein R3D69_14405 [Xanthobacteraceae bacterium]